MKTSLFLKAALVAVCALVITSVTGCKSKDKEPENTTNNKAVAALMESHFIITEDLLAMADVTIEFLDQDGQVQRDVMTTTQWEKSIKSTKLPAEVGFRVLMTPKEGADFTGEEKVRLGYEYGVKSYSVTAEGKNVSNVYAPMGSLYANSTRPYAINWINGISNKLSFRYAYDAEGQSTNSGNWE